MSPEWAYRRDLQYEPAQFQDRRQSSRGGSCLATPDRNGFAARISLPATVVLLLLWYQNFGAVGPSKWVRDRSKLRASACWNDLRGSNDFHYRFAVRIAGDGAGLPARRPRPPNAWPGGLPDSTEDDHREGAASANDLVDSGVEAFGENRSPASTPAGGMAGASSKIVAVPDGISVGCQCAGVHFSVAGV